MSGRDWTTAASTAATTTALTSLPIMVVLLSRWCRDGLADCPEGLDFVRGEVQETALDTLDVRVRVVLGQQRQVGVPVHVEQHGLDQRGPAGEEQVLRVRPPGARAHPDPAAAGDANVPDHDVIGVR